MDYQDIAVRVLSVGVPKFVRDMTTAEGAIDRVGKTHQTMAVNAEKSAAAHASAAYQLGGFIDRMGVGLDKHSKRLDRLGKQMTGIGLNSMIWAAPLAYGVKGSIDAYTQFAEAMSLTQRQARATGREMQTWGKQIMRFSPYLGSPGDLAKALYYPASSFGGETGRQKDQDVMNALRVSAMLAKIGGDTPENAANALKSVINANLRGTGKIHSLAGFMRIGSVFDQAVGAGDMRLPDLLESFSTEVLPEAKAAHMSLQGILAYTASLTKLGVPARVANTLSKLTVTRMLAPTKEGMTAMRKLGFSNPYQLGDDLKRTGNFVEAFTQLEDHLKRLPKDSRIGALSAIFGGSRGLPNAEAIMQTLGDYGGIVRYLNSQTTAQAFQRHYQQYVNTPGAKQDAFRAQLQQTEINLGKSLFPALNWALPKLTAVIGTVAGAFEHLSKPLKLVLGGMVLLGPAMLILGPFLRSFSLLGRAGGKGIRSAGWVLKKLGHEDLGGRFGDFGGGRSPLQQIKHYEQQQVGLLRQLVAQGRASTWQGIANDFENGKPGPAKWEREAIALEEDGSKVGGKFSKLLPFLGEGEGLTGRLAGLLPFLGEGTGLTGALSTVVPMLGEGGLAGALSSLLPAAAALAPELAAAGAVGAGAWGLGTTIGHWIFGNGNQALYDKLTRWQTQADKQFSADPTATKLINLIANQALKHDGKLRYKNGQLYIGGFTKNGWIDTSTLGIYLAGLKLPSGISAPHLTNHDHVVTPGPGEHIDHVPGWQHIKPKIPVGKPVPKDEIRVDAEIHNHIHLGQKEISTITSHVNAENRRRMNRR